MHHKKTQIKTILNCDIILSYGPIAWKKKTNIPGYNKRFLPIVANRVRARADVVAIKLGIILLFLFSCVSITFLSYSAVLCKPPKGRVVLSKQ